MINQCLCFAGPQMKKPVAGTGFSFSEALSTQSSPPAMPKICNRLMNRL